jgi:hypothetical protein
LLDLELIPEGFPRMEFKELLFISEKEEEF